jgi:sugar phosphate isomerase/epimerase
MQRVLSTYRYVHQPLSASLLGEIAHSEIAQIEIYCAPQHFSYRSQETVRELAGMLSDARLEVFSMHSPTERDLAPGRESGVPISICDTERIRRLDAMDEVKRALDVAERIPFRYLVQHIGYGRQMADPKKYDAAFSSLENLCVFAKARGVTIALENTPDDFGAPASLQQFVRETHLHDLKFCFDIGHAQMDRHIEGGFEAMRERIALIHVNDNHGEKDEHLLPHEDSAEGMVDWDAACGLISGLSEQVAMVMELKEQTGGVPKLDQVREAFDAIEKRLGGKRPRAAKS